MNRICAPRQYLNGLWQFQPAAGTAPEPPGIWDATPIQVPSYWNVLPDTCGGNWKAYDHFEYPRRWREASGAWYRLAFALDPMLRAAGGRVHLTFDAIAGTTRVVLNGQPLGENHDLFLPFGFDVTEIVRREGDNELLVSVGEPEKAGNLWLQPPGSWVGWDLRGIWQDVYIDWVPGCFVDDVFVRTSVDRMEVAADVTVHNDTDRLWQGSVSAQVRDDGRQALDLDPVPVAVGPSQSAVVHLGRSWTAPVFWSPEHPKLYDLVTSLTDPSGATVHRTATRFGFRQFEVQGTDLWLNGRKIRLFGDSWHYMGAAQQNADYARTWFRLIQEVGGNSVRLHAMPHPPCYLDVADAMGILVIDETAVYGSAGSLALADERFWRRARDHIRRLVLRDRNHPSVVLWSACNEVVWKGGVAVFPPLLSLEAEAKRLDPTRTVSFDENDSDLGGGAAIHGGHYGTAKHWETSWKRTKPLMVNEFCSLYHGGPHECSPYVGEAGYADFHARWRGAGLEAAQMFWQLRRLGAASITPWNVNWYCMTPLPAEPIELPHPDVSGPGVKVRRIGAHSLTLNHGYDPSSPPWQPNPAYAPIREAYTRRAFWVEREQRQGFGGHTVSLEVVLFNDASDPAQLTLRWDLELAGAPIGTGSVSADLGPYSNVTRSIALDLPSGRVPTQVDLRLRLLCDGGAEPVFAKSNALRVHPPARKASPASRLIGVAGGTPEEHRRIADCGYDVVPVSGPDAMPPSLAAMLLAPGGSGVAFSRWLDSRGVRDFLASGGTLLVLPGGVAGDPASPVTPLNRTYARAFVRAPDHPLLAGLDDADFADWPTQGPTVREVYIRPFAGEAWPLLDVGDATDGMRYTPLLLIPRGRGCIVLCGFDLSAAAEDVPAAATLLTRILDYEHRAPDRRALCVDPQPGEAMRRLVAETVGPCPADAAPPGAVWWCDASRTEAVRALTDRRKEVAALVRTGGTLVMSCVRPETGSTVGSLLDLAIDVREETLYNVAKAADSPLLAGINNGDLCWVYQDEKTPIVRHTIAVADPTARTLIGTVATRWEDYQSAAEQHKVGMMMRRIAAFDGPRAVMVEIPRGEGRILISQLLLDEAVEPFTAHAARVFSQLMTNLHVRRTVDGLESACPEEQFVDRQGYIKRWLVLGAFHTPGANPIDQPFIDEANVPRPEPRARLAGKTWREATFGWPQIDLRQVLGDEAKDHCAAYAAVCVHSPKDRSILLDSPDMVSLWLGSDDGVKVWLNGQPIGRFDYVRPLVLDQNRIDHVPLRRGWNLLLVKLAQSSGTWQFAARFVSATGGPVTDLKYSASAGAE